MASHSGKRLTFYIAAAGIICLLLFGSSWFYARQVSALVRSENYGFLSDVAAQSADTVLAHLDGDLRMLEATAVMLGDHPELDVEHWVDLLGRQPLFCQFQRIGIILPDGRGYGQDVTGLSFSDRDYFIRAMAGEQVISDMLVDRVTGKYSLTYAVPIVREGNTVGVLAAVTNTDVMQTLLLKAPFMGQGSTYLIQGDGNVMLSGGSSAGRYGNLLEDLSLQPDARRTLTDALAAGAAAKVEGQAGGEPVFLSLVPLGINNWYMVCQLPVAVVDEKSNALTYLTSAASAVVAVVFLAYIATIFLLQHRTRAKLYRLAYCDPLTGLANKNGFLRDADALLGGSAPLAYCVLDIKRFRTVNARFGYAQGDGLLRHTADVLTHIRQEGELISRFSGDSFHLLLHCENQQALEARLCLLGQRIGNYSFAADPDYRAQVGFGVYQVTTPEISVEATGDLARLTLGKIRDYHATAVSFYSQALRDRQAEEQEIEQDMHRALKNGEFQVYLQPKYRLEDECIASAETLVRWIHPRKGIIPPDCFIPLFERNGFIAELDLYMFRRLCDILQRWVSAGLEPFAISINQSRVNLVEAGYLDKLFSVFRAYNLPARYIVIEITEGAFVEDIQVITAIVGRLHSEGFRVSMDDFGAGYSCLNMLQDVLLDELKLDKNFFNLSANSERGQKIVQSVISMARELEIDVVAEGVETAEHAHFLRHAGCHYVQGYYYARPMPWTDFEQLAYGVSPALP